MSKKSIDRVTITSLPKENKDTENFSFIDKDKCDKEMNTPKKTVTSEEKKPTKVVEAPKLKNHLMYTPKAILPPKIIHSPRLINSYNKSKVNYYSQAPSFGTPEMNDNNILKRGISPSLTVRSDSSKKLPINKSLVKEDKPKSINNEDVKLSSNTCSKRSLINSPMDFDIDTKQSKPKPIFPSKKNGLRKKKSVSFAAESSLENEKEYFSQQDHDIFSPHVTLDVKNDSVYKSNYASARERPSSVKAFNLSNTQIKTKSPVR